MVRKLHTGRFWRNALIAGAIAASFFTPLACEPAHSQSASAWISLVEKHVSSVLVDPSAAAFRDETVNRLSNLKYPVVCGEVSGKTQYAAAAGGGEEGFKRFVANPNADPDHVILIYDAKDPTADASKRNTEALGQWKKYCESSEGAGTDTSPPPSPNAAPIGPGAVLNRTDLIAIARSVRSFVAKDEFDSPPAQPAISGRAFSIELTPAEGVSDRPCAGYPWWRYDANKQELEVVADSGQVFPLLVSPRGIFANAQPGDSVPVLQFDCRQISDGTYTAENGFGVAVNVHQRTEETVSLAIPESVEAEWSAHVEGDDARELSRAVRILITGVLREWTPGKVTLCYQDRLKPTVDFPFDLTTRDCAFNAESVQIEFIDARTGNVLYTAE